MYRQSIENDWNQRESELEKEREWIKWVSNEMKWSNQQQQKKKKKNKLNEYTQIDFVRF